MAYARIVRRCRKCRERTMQNRKETSHLLHLVLSIVTGGVWLLVWLFLVLFPSRWRCEICGKKN